MRLKSKVQGIINWWWKSKLFRFIEKKVSMTWRRKLHNDNFSILCSNCIGGIIYHRLGKKFLSPTINMHFSQPDFVSFCVFLDYYLKQDLVFVKTDKDYPAADLPGNGSEIPTIRLWFDHAKTEEDAAKGWNERKGRIKRENLFILMYNMDGVTVEQIKKLESIPCKGRAILSTNPIPGVPWCVVLKPNQRAQYPESFLDKNLLGIRTFEKQFDFVAWLNGEQS